MAEKTLTQKAIEHFASRQSYEPDEMAAVVSEIMEGKSTDAQIAAFLVALRMKGETVEEVTGAVEAMRAHMLRIHPQGPLYDSCGTGGDGAGTFNVSTAASFVVAGAGVTVAKHGNRSISSRCGSADVLAALGVNIEMPPPRVEQAINEIGIGFMFAPVYHGAMRFAGPARREIAVRSIFNILGPLSNPAGAKRQLVGVYDPALVETVAKVLKNLGAERAMVVHGGDGLDEITLTTTTAYAELKDGHVTLGTFDPHAYGFRLVTLDDIRGGDAAENAGHVREVLAGTPSAMAEITVVNAAAAMRIMDKASDWPAAIRLARESIASGAAAAKLAQLAAFSKSVTVV
jgi:anthranilate phosphoribosyltransferase